MIHSRACTARVVPSLLVSALACAGFAGACQTPMEPGSPDPDVPVPLPDASVPDDAPPVTPPQACPVANTQLNPSLVVNDPLVLQRFSFTRVMDQIRTTADVQAGQSTRSIFQAWMRTFGSSAASGDCNDTGVDPNHFGLVCPRRPEAKLATVDPFVASSPIQFHPVGLFNRFDLAPASGANCGEYRIVFAMSSSAPTIGGRALVIFEGALANPTPAAGIAACLPVARFWQGLTADPSATSRADKLERFYFTGNAVPGFPPVVSAMSYGLARGTAATHGAGQIRTNFFVDLAEWQLREFKTRRTCTNSADPSTCRLVIEHVTVKTNAGEELFTGNHQRSASFQSQFVAQVGRLTGTNVNSLSLAPADIFNEFESVSSTTNVNYVQFTFSTLRNSIQARLTQLGSPLSPTDILNRATTQTCAGCHQQSNNIPLGGGLRWPSSLEFTHVDENRQLSQALLTQFLPRRKAVLESFINARCAGPNAREADEAMRVNAVLDLTVGGGAVGAAN